MSAAALSAPTDERTVIALHHAVVGPFVAREGETFSLRALSKVERELVRRAMGRKSCPQKACFDNAQRVVLADVSARLEYAEGYARCRRWGWIHHGWIVLGGKVIDVTWRDRGSCYVGVRFARSFVELHRRTRGDVVTLLDDWEAGFPVVNDKARVWASVAPGKLARKGA